MTLSATAPLVAVISADDATRHAIRTALADLYQVVESLSADTAIPLCEDRHPGLVLLDTALPGAYTVCTELQTRLEHPPHLILLIESLAQVDGCLQAGADDCLPKPVHAGLLRRRTHRLLNAYEARRRLEATQCALEESNARFRSLFEHSPDAIFLLDYDEEVGQIVILDCNKRACDLNGYSWDELIGQPFALLNPAQPSPHAEQSLRQRLRQRGHIQMESRRYRKDGTIYPVEVVLGLVTLGSREIILSIDRDITGRKQAETSERRQRALAEALRDTGAALNSTLKLDDVLDLILLQAERVMSYNAASIAMLKGDVARVVRCRGFEDEASVLKIEFNVRQTPNHRQMLATRAPVIIPDTHTYPGWINFRATARVRSHVAAPIIFRDEVLGFIHLDRFTPNAFTDDDAATLQLFAGQVAIAVNNAQLYDRLNALYQDNLRYAAELEQRVEARTVELRRALDRERELSGLKSRFITVASHEFRTPLAVMLTASDLLKNYSHRMTEEQRLKHLTQIQTEIREMTRLLQDVLTVNRGVEGSAQDFAPTRFDLFQFGQKLLDDARAEDKGCHEFRLLTSGTNPLVWLDQKHTQNILTNLLSNAVKYSPSGSTITLAISLTDTQAVICVTDEGIGIPEADRRHLFEAFYRASNVGAVSGTGLGLTIVKQAADLHGGTVSVSTQTGVGSTFTVILPQPARENNTHGENSGC
ncbi:MAG: PAS domain S-box protein [Chloroflexi bacterium]|nr:PAS domain S-box protein [Chloroflexota bacterium]